MRKVRVGTSSRTDVRAEGICSTIATNLREMHAKRNDVKRLVSTVIRPSGQGARARTKYDPEEFL